MAISSSADAQAQRNLIADWLSPAEFRIVEAVCDTFFPILEPPAGSAPALTAYYRRSARDLNLASLLAETLGQENAEARAEFRQLLALLKNPLSGLLLAGSPRPFAALSQQKREKYLLAMANSPFPQLRQGYHAFKRLTGFLFYAVPDPQGANPTWQALDYTTPQLPPAPTPTPPPIQPLPITQHTTLEADAVIIGSGAGGSVVAGELALAGKNVIVLEKGGYNSEADFTLQEAQGMSELYLKRGTLTSKDLGLIVLAGSTLGGGAVINWMTSLRTPERVLQEWEQRSGLRGTFTGAALQDSFAAVEQRLHVNTEGSVHNRQNQLLLDGCQALGYQAGVLPRNDKGCAQRCGSCCFGCPYGGKQSTMKTYIHDAFAHGARILVHCSADKVLLEHGRAIGVQATATNTVTGQTFNVTIRAKAVIVAAGSIHSPALLLRSGLQNPHIGRHLKLHPTAALAGIYPNKVYAWQGVMQSAYSDEFGYLDGNYGYKLEVPPAHPGLLGLATPWEGALAYRQQMSHAANVATLIVLSRDKGEGSITLDRHGEPVINYCLCEYDRRHLLHGMRTAARLHVAAGATSVLSLHNKPARLERSPSGVISEQQYRAFDRRLEHSGMEVNRIMLFSAHQMATCRMGAAPDSAVIDANHEVFGVKGLFVCDASAFPSASGVNPMLSIMALAHKASQYLKTII